MGCKSELGAGREGRREDEKERRTEEGRKGRKVREGRREALKACVLGGRKGLRPAGSQVSIHAGIQKKMRR